MVLLCSVEVLERHVSGDAFWDLATGRWELLHHAVLRRNLFSWHERGVPWVNNEWLWGVILDGAWRQFGPRGLLAVPLVGVLAFVMGLAVWYRLMRLRGWVWIGAMLFGTLASFAFWNFRPQVWAYGLAVWSLAGLEYLRQRSPDQGRRTLTWLLPSLVVGFLFWLQIHGSWELLVLWAGLYAALAGRYRWTFAALAGALLVLALWANPWGPDYVWKAVFSSSSGAIANTIPEWHSPNFHRVFEALIVVPYLFLGRWRGRRQSQWLSWVMWAGFGLAALYAVRFFPYLALGTGYAWADWEGKPLRPLSWRVMEVGFAALAVIAFDQSVIAARTVARGNLVTGPLVSTGLEPVAVVQYMLKHGDTQRVLNAYRYGGYLTWVGIPDWIDGRAGFWLQTGDTFQAYQQARSGAVSPLGYVNRIHPEWIVAQVQNPLAWAVAGRDGWYVVMCHGGAELLGHRPAPQ